MAHGYGSKRGGNRVWVGVLGLGEQGVIGRNLGDKFFPWEPGWLACDSSSALGTDVGNFNA